MTLNERINALAQLGEQLNADNEHLQSVVRRTHQNNAWFTPENQWKAIEEVKNAFLNKEKLQAWVAQYPALSAQADAYPPFSKAVGLILAGNIPLVGLHDILCVFVAGFKSKIKLSEKDPYFIPFLIQSLNKIDPSAHTFFEITEGYLKDFDAVIATGSNNSARYFEAYFSKYPHIIRKNRNAVAILRGDETQADITLLGDDIFTYFGLGCRNVSKLYVPKGYNFEPFLETLHARNEIVLHDKYKNNFDYNFALLILNRVPYFSNGCILLRETTEIASPIAVLYFEYYDDYNQLSASLRQRGEEIQCVIAKDNIEGLPCFYFGDAQKPSLGDYADGVDTMAFLIGFSTND